MPLSNSTKEKKKEKRKRTKRVIDVKPDRRIECDADDDDEKVGA